MASGLVKAYAYAIRTNLRYHVNWLPNGELSLGDFGVMDRGVFARLGNLGQKGCAVGTPAVSKCANISYASEGVTRGFAAAKAVGAKIAAAASKAELSIKFDEKRSAYFFAAGCRVHAIQNPGNIGAHLARLHENGNGGQITRHARITKLVVVMELVEAKYTTVVLSQRAAAEIVIACRGDVTDADALLARGGLSVAGETHVGFKLLAEKARPLMKLWHLQWKWPGGRQWRPLKGGGVPVSTGKGGWEFVEIQP